MTISPDAALALHRAALLAEASRLFAVIDAIPAPGTGATWADVAQSAQEFDIVTARRDAAQALADAIRDANRDAARELADDGSDWAAERRAWGRAGCNADDTTDSRGRRLLPRVNEGGEHCGM